MSNDECSICTEHIDDSATRHSLECGHVFHASCICNWFRQGNPTCPNCRDVGSQMNHLNWPDSRARASALRRRARNSTAPAQLKALVKNVQKAEEKYKTIRKEMTDFRKNHLEIFKTWSKFRPRLFSANRRQREAIRMLGTFASPDFPLPNVQRN